MPARAEYAPPGEAAFFKARASMLSHARVRGERTIDARIPVQFCPDVPVPLPCAAREFSGLTFLPGGKRISRFRRSAVAMPFPPPKRSSGGGATPENTKAADTFVPAAKLSYDVFMRSSALPRRNALPENRVRFVSFGSAQGSFRREAFGLFRELPSLFSRGAWAFFSTCLTSCGASSGVPFFETIRRASLPACNS